MSANPTIYGPPEAVGRRAGWIVALLVALLGTVITFAHPVGDAPDESENLQYIHLIANEKRLAVPADRLRQSMHPPLAFVAHALATAPLEAIAEWLPREIVWNHWYRVTIPLNQRSQVYMREIGATTREGPSGFHHSTLLGLRLLDVAFMTAAAWLAAAAARTALPNSPVAACAAVGFLLLTPQAVLQSGAIGMEPLLLLFVSWGAFELARGLRPDLEYSPWRAGIAFGLAGGVRYAGFAAALAVLPVAWARHKRVGTPRALEELLFFGLLAPLGVGGFILYNLRTSGDPLVFRTVISLFPEMARPSPANATDLDDWGSQMVSSFFGLSAPGLHPSQTAMVLYFAIAGAGLVTGFLRSSSAPVPGLRGFAVVATAAIAVIPFVGNIYHYQMSGRYLLPAVPFTAPLLAHGLGELFHLPERSRRAWLLPLLPAATTLFVIAFSLIPNFAPRTSQLRGAVAYADCGGSFDPGRVRGTPVRPTMLIPSPEYDVTADPVRVEYEFPVAGPADHLWLHLLLPGASLGARAGPGEPSTWKTGDFAYQAARVTAGEEVVATSITPRAKQTVWSYPLPANAVKDGKLVLGFDRVGTAPFVAVAEIRIDRERPPSKEHYGPRIRVSAADAREGAGVRILDLNSQSIFARRASPGTAGKIIETPSDSVPPGHYLLRTRLRVEGGKLNETVGYLIVGEGGQEFARRKAIAADASKVDFQSIVQEFDILDGPPQTLTCRVETLGNATIAVDDIELYGPFAPL